MKTQKNPSGVFLKTIQLVHKGWVVSFQLGERDGTFDDFWERRPLKHLGIIFWMFGLVWNAKNGTSCREHSKIPKHLAKYTPYRHYSLSVKIGHAKRELTFQPSMCRCELLVSGRIADIPNHGFFKKFNQSVGEFIFAPPGWTFHQISQPSLARNTSGQHKRNVHNSEHGDIPRHPINNGMLYTSTKRQVQLFQERNFGIRSSADARTMVHHNLHVCFRFLHSLRRCCVWMIDHPSSICTDPVGIFFIYTKFS